MTGNRSPSQNRSDGPRTRKARRLAFEVLEERVMPDTSPFEYVAPTDQALSATLRLVQDSSQNLQLQVVKTSDQSVLKEQGLATTSLVTITGSGKADTIKLDLSKSIDIPVTFNAGSGSTTPVVNLEIAGPGASLLIDTAQAIYTPDATLGKGAVKIGKSNISFTGVAALTADQLLDLKVAPPGPQDNLQIDKPADGQNRIAGTSNNNAIVPVTFHDAQTVVLDTSSNDSTNLVTKAIFGNAGDHVSLSSDGLLASGLKFFTINTGLGSATLTLYGTDYSTPVAGGEFDYNGGGTQDTIIGPGGSASGTVDGSGNGTFNGTKGSVVLKGIERIAAPLDRPVIFIPEWTGSFAADSAMGEWFSKEGLSPDKLVLDPITNQYGDVMTTLQNVGYTLGESLFVANWDWRLPLAPLDGTINGKLSSITTQELTGTTYKYGVDYLGYALKQAAESWVKWHPGQTLPAVDIVAHGEGGLLARAYIQSTAYAGQYASGKNLPAVNNFVSLSTPNQGSTAAWNLLHDNWGANTGTLVLSIATNLAFQRIVQQGTITTPTGTIGIKEITQDGSATGTPDPQTFIRKYLPSLTYILPTFAFIDPGTGTLADVNANAT
jgi:hypothetical protein